MTPKTQIPAIDKWFVNKDSYLAWRTAWKEAYARLSAEIKEHKKDRKSDPDPIVRSFAQGSAAIKRKRAAYLLEVRKESKLEAQRQYQAAKAKTAVAA